VCQDESVSVGATPTRRTVWIVGVNLVFVVLAVGGYRWATQPATWPTELNPARSEELLSNAEQPTADDMVLLEELITEIALSAPVITGLLGSQEWPAPEISPAFWVQDGSDARSVVIGGSFRLSLDDATYLGAWPSAGCRSGKYQGTVRSIDGRGLRTVDVLIDLTFERVTNLTIGPPALLPANSASTQPEVRFNPDLEKAPWYTGTCPRFSFGD